MRQSTHIKLPRFHRSVRRSRDIRTAPWKVRLFRSAPRLITLGPLTALLISPLVVFHFGFRAADFVTMMIGHFLTIGGITLGYHRSLAHRGVELSNRTRLTALIAGAMAAQGPPSFWVAHHRAHHSDPDGSNDPHSPWAEAGQSTGIVAFLHAHIGWMLEKEFGFDSRLIRDIRKDSIALWVDQYYVPIVLAGLVLPALLVNIAKPDCQSVLLSAYWVGLVRISITHQATWMVNSVCHLWGYRNYCTTDQSRNNWVVAIFTLGEGWHNNHHADPRNARHGQKWWEIDPTYFAIRLLGRLNLARYGN